MFDKVIEVPDHPDIREARATWHIAECVARTKNPPPNPVVSFGPLFFGLVIEATGSIQHAMLSVVVFFVLGGFVLSRVNVEEGQRQALAAEARLS